MKIHIINPSDRDWTKHRYLLQFGAYGWTVCMVWANSLDAALDECVDWLVSHAPGLLADEQVAEEFALAKLDGLTDEEAAEKAEVDTTRAGNCGNYLNSWEWGILAEDPSRQTIKEIEARS